MEVRAERIGAAVVFSLEGPLTVEADTRRLHALVRWTTHHVGCDIVLDFANVPQLDCAGIGQLVEMHARLCRCGGGLVLVNVGRRLERMLNLAGLLIVFPVFATLDAALDWCGAGETQDRLFPRPRMAPATLADATHALERPKRHLAVHGA